MERERGHYLILLGNLLNSTDSGLEPVTEKSLPYIFHGERFSRQPLPRQFLASLKLLKFNLTLQRRLPILPYPCSYMYLKVLFSHKI